MRNVRGEFIAARTVSTSPIFRTPKMGFGKRIQQGCRFDPPEKRHYLTFVERTINPANPVSTGFLRTTAENGTSAEDLDSQYVRLEAGSAGLRT